jgi:thiosulfate reductase cytochrome b subunit
MQQPSRRHHWIVRLTHWGAFILIFGMIASGLQIYRAYPRFGQRGGPYLPNPLQDAAFPLWSRLGGWLAGGINWHFTLMWPLIAAGLLYLGYLAASGEGRLLFFRPGDVRPALEMVKYYLRIRKDHPPQGKHNALQKVAYTGIIILGALSVLSGIAMWKPVQLAPLTALFGGFQAARYWHFISVWLFVAFTIVHVLLVFVADPASLRAMLTGRYRGRYTSVEP